MRDPKHDVLFHPIELGPKVMPNRFWQTPHSIQAGSDFPGFQAGYRQIKAEGGWGAIFIEATSIAVDADADPLTIGRLWDDDDVANLAWTTKSIHEYGALAGVELFYGGAPVTSGESRHPYLGPSQMITDANPHGAVAEMDGGDIALVQRLYVDAALRARDAGFDLITVQAGHAISVISKFLIPRYNHRTDGYGGSFENRMRFARETVEAVRAAVGVECAVGMRFQVDTLPPPYGFGEDGIQAAREGFQFIAAMDDIVDYWDLTVGGMSAQGEDIGPSRTHPENHQREFVGGAKDFTVKPVVNVGRFTNPDTMAQVIRTGQCDIIGAARPSIADPFLPRKIDDGRLDEIRECIGCNYCISRFDSGSRIACTQNATSGEEYRRGWHPEIFTPAKNRDNNVLIVGAGPAGMECAIVLGKRDLNCVHLIDAEAEMGGCVRWIAKLPGLNEWSRMIDYRSIQLDKLNNVEAILGSRLSADDIRDYGAEIVVIATGARWADDGRCGAHMDPVPGADATQPHVATPEQVMTANKPIGQRVTVFDSDGYFMGYSLAERLARLGHDVTLVTNHAELSPYSHFTSESPRVNRGIRALGVRVITGHYLTEINHDHVVAREVWSETTTRIVADSTVLVTQRYSDSALYHDLKAAPEKLEEAGITGLYRIGDCFAPNFLAEAVYSGHRLGREIDSADPARPLPYIRERRLLKLGEDAYRLPRTVMPVPLSPAR